MKALFIFSAIFSFCLSLMSLDYKRVYADQTHALEIGQVGMFETVNHHGSFDDILGGEKLSGSWQIRLVGDHTMEKLPQPEVIYFIRVNPTSSTSFKLELGCKIITHVSEFKLQGIESSKEELFRLNEFLQDFDKEHYIVWKSLLGGGKIVYENYETNKKNNIPKKFFKEFYGKDDGLREFLQESVRILKQYKSYKWRGCGGVDSPQITNSTEIELFDCTDCLASKIINNVLILSNYIENFKNDKALIRPQIYVVEPIKTLDQAQYKFYEKITSNDFEMIPELNDLAKYTVKGYKQLDDNSGLNICRLYVYPNECGEHSRVVKHDVVWINVEGKGTTLQNALQNAVKEINNRL